MDSINQWIYFWDYGLVLLITCSSPSPPPPPTPHHNMILICLVATGDANMVGSIFMVFSGPVFVIAFLSIAYLISREEELHEYVFCKVDIVLMFLFSVLTSELNLYLPFVC